MSDLFEKRPDGASRRQTRLDKEQKDKKKTRIISVSVSIMFALIFIAALLVNSKFIRRVLPAVSIDGISFSVAEFDYFFTDTYYNYQQTINEQLGEYASYMLPSTEEPLSSQVHDEEAGTTWEDYLTGLALENMTDMVKIVNAAKKDPDFELSQEAREDIDNGIDALRTQATTYQYPSLDGFLQAAYGNSLNERTMRKIFEFTELARAYSKHKYDSLTYTQSEIDAYYSENKDDLDSLIFRILLVTAETLDSEDFDSTEDYDIATEVAKLTAQEHATSIVDQIESGGDDKEEEFIKAALEYDPVAYADPATTLIVVSGSNVSEQPYGEWLFDEARSRGDITTEDIDSGTYVVCYVDRDSNEYEMTSMRQILVQPEAVDSTEYDEGEEDPEYIIAVQLARAEAQARAETVWNLFLDGGATEDKLLELMEENSTDTTEGGFYENITKNMSDSKMVPEIEDFLFAPDRKKGDHELIETEAYGYHIVFFMGYGERYCDYLATNNLREKDYQAWSDSLVSGTAVQQWAVMLRQHR